MTNKEQWEVGFRAGVQELLKARSDGGGFLEVFSFEEFINELVHLTAKQTDKAREEGKKEGEKNLPYWLSRGLKQGYREGLQKALELIPTLPDERKVAIFKGTEARTYEEKILARNVLLEAKEAIQNELNSKEKS